MTTSKIRRRGLSQSLVQVGLSTLSFGLLCAFGVSLQQLPPQEELPQSRQDANTPLGVPTVVPPVIMPRVAAPQSVPSEDFQNDPLFLEIKKIVQQGSAPSATASPSSTPAESIRHSRWHAVESILAAARMLESEVAECVAGNDADGAAKTQKAIRSLRAQALELLQ